MNAYNLMFWIRRDGVKVWHFGIANSVSVQHGRTFIGFQTMCDQQILIAPNIPINNDGGPEEHIISPESTDPPAPSNFSQCPRCKEKMIEMDKLAEEIKKAKGVKSNGR